MAGSPRPMPAQGPAEAAEAAVELSVVMPCLNEAETVGACVDKALGAMAAGNIRGEVVVGDNGSTDGAVEIARRHGARVVHVAEAGYGAALMGAIEAAQGRFIVMGDADDSYDFTELDKFLAQLREGHDFVMGCRLPRGGGRIMPDAMPGLHRWLGTPVLTALSRLFFGARFRDINCGMRGFRRDAYERMELQTTGMEFASEMVVKATLLGLRCAEVPITLHPDGRSRPPHLRSWRDGWRHLRFMLLYSPRWLYLIPGLSLFLFGGVMLAALARGPLFFGSIGLDTNTQLVAALAVLVGFQLVALGVFAKAFAVAEGLLPPGRAFGRIAGLLRVEYGVLAGLTVSVLGAALLAWAVAIWGGTGFGDLVGLGVQRIVIPAVTLIMLGVQGVSAAFFLGVLGLRRRRRRPGEP